MNSIIDMVREIKKRQGMYFPDGNLRDIRIYLSGYAAALIWSDPKDPRIDFKDALFVWWLAKTKGMKKAANIGWDTMINKYALNNKLDPTQEFYKLVEQFASENVMAGKSPAPATVQDPA